MKTLVLTFVIALMAGIVVGQRSPFPKPREETLLNNLSVLIWKKTGAEKVSLSLRVHSGSAFDPVGKEGTAKLLTQLMFPDNGIFEDFAEELGGSLKVESNYDYFQIDMVADKDKLVPILQILAGAINNTQIDKVTTAEAKNARLKELTANAENPTAVADAEIANRLYGSFPYGRSQGGTIESMSKIDFADILFAKQRFLAAENATLSISGDFSTSYVYRAARRLLGGWKKGTGRVPANFTLPEDPDTAPLVVNTDFGVSPEKRFAVEAVSRSDSSYFASEILVRALRSRLKKDGDSQIRYKRYLLRGYLVMSELSERRTESMSAAETNGTETESINPLLAMLSNKVTSSEFERAKKSLIADFITTKVSDHWFDIDTYKLKSVDDEFQKLQNVSLPDVLLIAEKIATRPFVDVTVMPLEPSKPLNNGDPDDPR